MSRETSVGTGKPYGLERVCRVLEFPRSTVYAQQARESANGVALHPQRRSPETEPEGWNAALSSTPRMHRSGFSDALSQIEIKGRVGPALGEVE